MGGEVCADGEASEARAEFACTPAPPALRKAVVDASVFRRYGAVGSGSARFRYIEIKRQRFRTPGFKRIPIAASLR